MSSAMGTYLPPLGGEKGLQRELVLFLFLIKSHNFLLDMNTLLSKEKDSHGIH